MSVDFPVPGFPLIQRKFLGQPIGAVAQLLYSGRSSSQRHVEEWACWIAECLTRISSNHSDSSNFSCRVSTCRALLAVVVDWYGCSTVGIPWPALDELDVAEEAAPAILSRAAATL